ncbi:hypothetical protein HOA91_00105 [Candidatus Woesearchaeota archaeon]|jgi:hypothetical protein|nr:hypothetical protein [Candidatus Woesearchaeota archaeon]
MVVHKKIGDAKMVVIKGKSNSNKSKSAHKSASNNAGVDKHKAWLIIGITVAILFVAILVLAPSITDGVFGKAVAGPMIGEEVKLNIIGGADDDFLQLFSANFDVVDDKSHQLKTQRYVFYNGIEKDGGEVQGICICPQAVSKDFSCPLYKECLFPEAAVEDLKTDVTKIVNSGMSASEQVVELSKTKAKADRFVNYLGESSDEAVDAGDEEKAVKLNKVEKNVENIQSQIAVNLASALKGRKSTTDDSPPSLGGGDTTSMLHCDTDNPTDAYSSSNAPANVCLGTNGETKILLVGNGLGYKNKGLLKSMFIGGVDEGQYKTGNVACQKQLKSNCLLIQKHNGVKWEGTPSIYPECGEPVQNYVTSGGRYRAFCDGNNVEPETGTETFTIPIVGSTTSDDDDSTVTSGGTSHSTTSDSTVTGGTPR